MPSCSGPEARLARSSRRSLLRKVLGIVRRTGRIDIVFNAIGPWVQGCGNGKLATELSIDEFMIPVTRILKSQFITASVASPDMMKQPSAPRRKDGDDAEANDGSGCECQSTAIAGPCHARAVAFLASEHARIMIGTVLNSSSGAAAD